MLPNLRPRIFICVFAPAVGALIFIGQLILPLPAWANVFMRTDAYDLSWEEKQTLELSQEIIQMASVVEPTTRSTLDQGRCLFAVVAALDTVMNRLDAISDLVLISADMKDKDDEQTVIATLRRRVPFAIQEISSARTHALKQAALCPTSALVNNYVQKAAALTDEATSAINRCSARISH